MNFNVDKCKFVHYGKRSIEFEYSSYGHPLEKKICELSSPMTWRLRGNVRKLTVKPATCWGSSTEQYNPKVLLPLYKSIVRPHLKYCSAIWSPQYVKDKFLLERIQHRFSRMFSELKRLPYEQRLNKMGLWTLEELRNRADLLEISKLIKGCLLVTFLYPSREQNYQEP